MRCIALAAAVALAGPAFAQKAGSPEPFHFVVLGDMPYNLPDDYARFDRLIAEVNRIAPAFTIHVGDIKSGSTPCTDENFQKVKDQFATFSGPLLYTPGDNEWTDCHREKAGRFDPLERLQKLRAMFFTEARSLGGAPVAVERQADISPEHKTFVENARLANGGVLVATVHVVGSNNNFEVRDAKAASEFFARDAAAVAWIEDTFRKAGADGSAAVVFAMQADMLEGRNPDRALGSSSGFNNVVDAIANGAETFGKPVLMTYGDSHVLRLERMLDGDGKPLRNVFALQVPGEDLIEAVRVSVDPANPTLFGFQLISPAEQGAL